METFFLKKLKRTIIERLNDYEGYSSCGDELPYLLFDKEVTEGTVLNSPNRTIQFIKDNFNLFGRLVEHIYTVNYDILNPLLYPEKAHVSLLLEAAAIVLSQLPFIEENIDEFELTKINIKQITKELNELFIYEEDLF